MPPRAAAAAAAAALLLRLASSSSAAAPPCASIPAGAPWTDCTLATQPSYGPLPATSASLATTDAVAQALFSRAEACAAGNTLEMAPGFAVLVEGGGYSNVWLETQPMGGAMYGVRNLTLAVNNQLVFVRTQRADGRLPGMVTSAGGGGGVVHPTYSYPGNANLSMLQGFYMASPAVEVAALVNVSNAAAAAAFLAELRPALEAFEAWLWAERNSSDGVLWLSGTADTGEDNSDKYAGATGPFESMDMMGYAHDAQRALARIAAITGDGAAEARWAARMAATAASLKARLWREELGAAFDRERDGAQDFVTTLVHNNLRAMWSGAFDQGMADAFVARHLMNSSEFWPNTPLPSIAVSDPRFRNTKGNNWSGPPEGLTFQRAIRALSSYGHHAELMLAGALQSAALAKTLKFPQQIDPFSSQPDSGDCYGPMLLSMLEFSAMTTGIAVRPGPSDVTLLWSAIAPAPTTFSFVQTLGADRYELAGFSNGTFVATRNSVLVFSGAGRARVVTGLDGAVRGVVGASNETETVDLSLPPSASSTAAASPGAALRLVVAPNEEWAVGGAGPPVLTRKVPFIAPF